MRADEHADAAVGCAFKQAGSLVIGTFSSVATHVLPDAIGRFQARHPGIEYELRMGDYSEIESWVAEGLVDFGFLPYPPQEPREGLAREVVLEDGRLTRIEEARSVFRLQEEAALLREKGGLKP